MDRSIKSTAWARYWATGAVDTFGSQVDSVLAAPGDASPPLLPHWRQWMRSLPSHGQMLDVGCGNGVVLAHLLNEPTLARWQGVGIDIVQPNPLWLQRLAPEQRARVSFQAPVSADQLPWSDASFHLVASQFGIEYADLSRAAAAAVRVLKPGGTLAWAIHRTDGHPARLAREELTHLDWLEESGFMRVLSSALVGADSQRPTPEDLRHWNAWVQALVSRQKDSSCPDLLHDVQLWAQHAFAVQRSQGDEGARVLLSRYEDALLENRTRLEDLMEHARPAHEIQALLSQLVALGMVPAPTCGPLIDRGHEMAWWVHATKRAPSDP